MKNNPLVSIIVPVYKVEKFLDRCVESILRQSYEKLDIILVDDGSPDNCGKMCDGWAEKDGRIHVLHKANGGLSDARNQGVSLARGEYISFIDSDDYVSEDYVQYLLELMEQTGADIACGSCRVVHGDGEDFSAQPEENVLCFDNVSFYQALCSEHYMPLVTAWGKLFPAQAVRENPFPVGRLHEDEAFSYKLYRQCRETALGTREIYAYYQNPGSITHTKTRKNSEAALLAFSEQFDYFAAEGCRPLQIAAAKRLISTALYLAGQGDEASAEFLKSGQAGRFIIPGLDMKARIRYHSYRLLGFDPGGTNRKSSRHSVSR